MSRHSKNCVTELLQREQGSKQLREHGQNGVKSFVRNRYETGEEFEQKDIFGHFGCINAIEFSQDGQYMVSGGDDGKVLLWPVSKCITGHAIPQSMDQVHQSNIFSLAINYEATHIYSGANDCRFLVHDASTQKNIHSLNASSPIYSVSVDQNGRDSVLLATHERRVLMYDTRTSKLNPLATKTKGQHFSVQHNPCQPELILISSSFDGITLYDQRHLRHPLMNYHSGFSREDVNYATFNRAGNLILALRPRLPPALYNLKSSNLKAQFDDRGYYNSTTMKSCCFAGLNDEYIISGSDDYTLYLWKLPNNILYNEDLDSRSVYIPKAFHYLRGHRSIVNQVRFNYAHSIIASSGVEKVIKLWSPFTLDGQHFEQWTGNAYTQSIQDINQFNDSAAFKMYMEKYGKIWNRHEQELLREDGEMISFFHTLVRKDIEGANLGEYLSSSDCSFDEGYDEEETKKRSLKEDASYNSVNFLLWSIADTTQKYAKVLASKPKRSSNASSSPSTRRIRRMKRRQREGIPAFFNVLVFDSSSDEEGEEDTEDANEKEFRKKNEKCRKQMLIRLKRLKPIKREIFGMLRMLRIRLDSILKAAEEALKSEVSSTSDFLPDKTSFSKLKDSEIIDQIQQLYNLLSWSKKCLLSWSRIVRYLERLREEHRVTNLPIPIDLCTDACNIFILMVYHMIKLLLERGFNQQVRNPEVKLQSLTLGHLRDVQRSIVYLWRECVPINQEPEISFLYCRHDFASYNNSNRNLDSEEFSSSITVNESSNSSNNTEFENLDYNEEDMMQDISLSSDSNMNGPTTSSLSSSLSSAVMRTSFSSSSSSSSSTSSSSPSSPKNHEMNNNDNADDKRNPIEIMDDSQQD